MTNRLAGIMLGIAVGDALGLPAEGLSPRRRQRLLPGPWRHRLLSGRGRMGGIGRRPFAFIYGES